MREGFSLTDYSISSAITYVGIASISAITYVSIDKNSPSKSDQELTTQIRKKAKLSNYVESIDRDIAGSILEEIGSIPKRFMEDETYEAGTQTRAYNEQSKRPPIYVTKANTQPRLNSINKTNKRDQNFVLSTSSNFGRQVKEEDKIMAVRGRGVKNSSTTTISDENEEQLSQSVNNFETNSSDVVVESNDANVAIEISTSEVIGSCTFPTQNDPSNNSTIYYKVTFDSEIDSESFSSEDIVTDMSSGMSLHSSWNIEDCGDKLNFMASVNVSGDGEIKVSILEDTVDTNDGGKNTSSTSNDNVIELDFIEPDYVINQSSLETVSECLFTSTIDPVNTTPISFRVQFSEKIDVDSFTSDDISQEGSATIGSWKVTNCGDDKNFLVQATAISSEGTVIPKVNSSSVNDPAGNVNSSALVSFTDREVLYDTTAPSAIIEQSVSETIGSCTFNAQADPTGLQTIEYKLSFSESINPASFSISDIEQKGTSTTINWNIANCGDNTTFKVSTTSISNDGTVIPELKLSSIEDDAGNVNSAVTSSTDNVVNYDNSPATVTIEQSISENVGSCSFSAQAEYTNSAPLEYKVSFSEPIDTTSFTASDIDNSGSGGSSVTWSITNCGDDINFSLKATSVTGDGTIEPNIAIGKFDDKYANTNSAASSSTDNSVTFDTTKPNVSVEQSISETIGSCNFPLQAQWNSTLPLVYKVVFDEKIELSSFSSSDITQAGTATVASWSIDNCGDDQTFILKATSVTADGSVIPNILSGLVTDLATNTNNLSSSTDNLVNYDTAAPSATIEQSVSETIGSCSFSSQADPTGVLPIKYKIVFSEQIVPGSLDVSDISQVGSATISSWNITSCGDGLTYLLEATSVSADGTIQPRLGASTFTDLSGNANSALSTSIDNSVLYDNTPATVTIEQSISENVGSCSFSAQAEYTNSAPLEYKVSFSEPIDTTSFTASDIDNSGSGGSSITWSITNCGDDINFSLKATSVTGDGTIEPNIAIGKFDDKYANTNSAASSSTDNSVTFDTTKPNITIEQSVSETIGSCTFPQQADSSGSFPISFKLTTDEYIDSSTLIVSDLSQTGSVTISSWSIDDCGDGKNFLLKANASSDTIGTVIPELGAGVFSDLAGNTNNVFSATDNSVLYSTNPFVWLGDSGDGLWSSAGNWLGGSVPGPSDIAEFGPYCNNCNVTVDIAANIQGLLLRSTYTGSVTLGANLNVGSSDLKMYGGTFNLGSFTIVASDAVTMTGGTLNAQSSLLKLTANSSPTLNTGSHHWNNVEFAFGTSSDRSMTITGTMYIDGNLVMNTNPTSSNESLKNGLLVVEGNINIINWNNYATTTDIKVVGSNNQLLSRTTGSLYGFEIAKTGGTLTLDPSSSYTAFSGDFKYTSGNVDVGTSEVRFSGYNATIDAGSLVFHDVRFSFGYTSIDTYKSIVGTLNVNNKLIMNTRVGSARENITNGTIDVKGDIEITNWEQWSASPTGVIKVSGSVDQYITGSIGTKRFPNLIIDKPSGTLYLGSNNYRVDQDFTHISGSVDAGTSVFNFGGYSSTITPGSVSFYDVTFTHGSADTTTNTKTIVGSLNITNDLILNTRTDNTADELIVGTINVSGDINVLNLDGDSTGASLNLIGSADQSVSITAGSLPGNINVNKASGKVVSTSDINLTGAGQDLHLIQGQWDMADNNLSVSDNLTLDSGTIIYKGCGTLTQGSLTNNGAIYGCLSSSPPAISGASGGSDSNIDAYLNSGSSNDKVTINWSDSSDEFSYEIAIYENDGTTLKCPVASIAKDLTSYSFSSCSLTQGKLYKVDLKALDYLGNKVDSSNNMYSFLYSPDVSIDDPTVVESAGTIDFTVTLNVASDEDLSVDYSTSDNTALSSGLFKDYNSTSATLTISAGNTTGIISIPLIDGSYDEPDNQDFTLTLTNPIAAFLSDSTATGTITDDDPEPSLSISDSQATESGGPISFVVALSTLSEKTISFNWSTTDGTGLNSTDFSGGSGGPVTISPASASVPVDIATIDNSIVCQIDRDFTITLNTLTNAVAGTVSATGTVIEDDYPELSVSNAQAAEGEALLFTIDLSVACPYQDVTVNYNAAGVSASAGNDFVASTGSFSIKKGETSNVLTIQTIDDTQIEQVETFNVIASGEAGFGSLTPAIGKGTINDNDSGTPKITKIAPGVGFTCALFGDGVVKCWGTKKQGRILDSSFHIGDEAAEIGDNSTSVNLGSSGEYAVKVAHDYYSTCVLLNTNEVKCFGGSYGYHVGGLDVRQGSYPGQMGDNLGTLDFGTSDTIIDLVAGDSHKCVVFNTGKIKCFGDANYGQLGYESTDDLGGSTSTMGLALPYVDLGTSRTVKKLSLGSEFSCAILDNDLVKCWGRGGAGRTGLELTSAIGDEPLEMGDNLNYIDLGTGHTAKDISLGSSHACVILDDDRVKCWGDANYGKLGYGNTNDLGGSTGDMGDSLPYVDLGTGRTAKKIFAGHSSTCAILDNDDTKCWGNSSQGQLARGSTSSRGDGANEMGDNLAAIDLGASRYAIDINHGEGSTCFLLDDFNVRCFGGSKFGRFANGSSEDIGDNAGEVGDGVSISSFGTGRTVKTLSSSAPNSKHFCYILDNDDLKCFGTNYNGQLGLGNHSVGDEPAEMGSNLKALNLGSGVRAKDLTVGNYHACIQTTDDKLKCWGQGTKGQTGYGTNDHVGDEESEIGDNLAYIDLGTGRSVSKVVAGGEHTCVILDNSKLKCFGEAAGGRLGYENTNDRGTSPGHMGDSLLYVDLGTNRFAVDIALGDFNTCALLDNGDTKCWGSGDKGRNVSGNSTSYGDDAGEMGDALSVIDVGTSKLVSTMALGPDVSCFVLNDNSLKCWGANRGAQLGQGFGGGGANDYIGDSATEIGDALSAVELGSNLTISNIAVGGIGDYGRAGYTCIVFTNGKVKCFGREKYYGPSYAPLGLEAQVLYGNNPSDMGDNLPYLNLGSGINAVSVYARYFTTCVLFDNEEFKCFGQNDEGELGYGHLNAIGDDVGEMGDNLDFVDVGDSGGPIGNFGITGITGGSDTIEDSYLGNSEATLNWGSASGATQYTVSILESDGSTVKCSEVSTAATTYSFTGCTLTEGSIYYAKVVAEDGAANIRSANNSIYQFIVDTTPPSSFNITGITGGLDSTVDSTLADGLYARVGWETSPDAFSYDVTIYESDGSTIKCPTVNVGASYTDYLFSDCVLSDLSSYRAQVTAKDALNQTTSASNSQFSFSVSESNAPASFLVTGITNGADVTLDTILENGTWATINWNDTTGENSYDITLFESDGTTVKCPTVNVPMDTTSVSFDTCDLTNGNSYQVEVIAKDTFSTVEATNSKFGFIVSTSSAGSFSISGITGNSNDATFDSSLSGGNEATISWASSSGATSYDVAIYDEAQSEQVCAQVNTTGLSHTFSDCYLVGNKTYIARVISKNGVEDIEAFNSPYEFSVANYPLVSIDNPSVSEGSNIVFNVSLSNSWSHDVSVDWKIAALNATSGSDFIRSSGSVVITAGNTSETITINTVDDNISELSERLIVSLHNPSSAKLGVQSIGIATITDSDVGVHVSKVVTGLNNTCAVKSDGGLKCWGYSAQGRSGLPDMNIGDEPAEMGDNLVSVAMPTGRTAIQVDSAIYSACALLDNGKVVCWGQDSERRLGSDSGDVGGFPNQTGDNFYQLDFGPGRSALKISMFNDHGCALLDDATIRCWGQNSSGQLGIGSTTDKYVSELSAVDLGAGRSAKDVQAGGNFTCALLDNDQVKCWGAGGGGRLGYEDTATRGKVATDMGDNLPTINFGTGRSVKKLSVGWVSSCVILDNDETKCWGDNNYYTLASGNSYGEDTGDEAGEMGDGLMAIDFGTGRYAKEVRVSNAHSCALLDNDLVKCWGHYDNYGALGIPRGNTIGNSLSDLGDNLAYVDFGRDGSDNLLPVSKISIGNLVTCALLQNGDYKCIGLNDTGTLGYGHRVDLGSDSNDLGNNLAAIDLGTGRSAQNLSHVFSKHQCIILDDSSVKCWGRDSASGGYGFLGTENSHQGANSGDIASLTNVDLGTSRSTKDISYNYNIACSILDNDKVKCFGAQGSQDPAGYGQADYIGALFGDWGDNLSEVPLPNDKNIIKVLTLNGVICYLFDDFNVSCMGNNGNGRLGLELPTNTHRGTASGHWGSNMQMIDFGADQRVLNIFGASGHMCAILSDFRTKCWGYDNGYGMLGNGYNTGTTIGDTVGEMGDNLAYVNVGTNRRVVDMSLSDDNTCALLDDDSVKCWGGSTYKQNGINSTAQIGDDISEMGDSLAAIDFSGATPLKIYSSPTSFTQCALIDNAGNLEAKCWGRASYGVSGQESTSTIGSPSSISPIDFGTSRYPTSLSVGEFHACAILDNGELKCWGKNFFGQLGIDTNEDMGDEPLEMGDNLPNVGI